MLFTPIDPNHWERAEHYNHFLNHVPCTYSMVAKIDITNIKKKGLKLYPAMLYALTTVVNQNQEFRTGFNTEEQLGVYDQMIPCYTIFHKDTETFSNLWTPYDPQFSVFLANYEEDLKRYGTIHQMNPKPNLPENNFPVSMVPWVAFEGFNLNLKNSYEYLIPIFTLGKYQKEQDRYLLPLAIQVHHSVCDGFHVGRFFTQLQQLIDSDFDQ